VIIDASATHGTVEVLDSMIDYTPEVGYTGYDSVFYDITDGHGGYTTGRVDVTVESNSLVHDSGTIRLISSSSSGINGNGYSDTPSISSDGRYIAFTSGASNLKR
jgi:hypothetical protein